MRWLTEACQQLALHTDTVAARYVNPVAGRLQGRPCSTDRYGLRYFEVPEWDEPLPGGGRPGGRRARFVEDL